METRPTRRQGNGKRKRSRSKRVWRWKRQRRQTGGQEEASGGSGAKGGLTDCATAKEAAKEVEMTATKKLGRGDGMGRRQ